LGLSPVLQWLSQEFYRAKKQGALDAEIKKPKPSRGRRMYLSTSRNTASKLF